MLLHHSLATVWLAGLEDIAVLVVGIAADTVRAYTVSDSTGNKLIGLTGGGAPHPCG